MSKEIFSEMLENAKGVFPKISVIIDAIAGHGGYSSGQLYFSVDPYKITLHNSYAEFNGICTSLGISDKKFKTLIIPYDRIIGIGMEYVSH